MGEKQENLLSETNKQRYRNPVWFFSLSSVMKVTEGEKGIAFPAATTAMLTMSSFCD